jgi:hypothetical protein
METGKPLPDEKLRALTPEEWALQHRKSPKQQHPILRVKARDRVHEWFVKGQQLTKHQAERPTLLLDASMVGDTEAARALLEKGVRVLFEHEFEDGVKYTALHFAAAGGYKGVVYHSRVHEMHDILNP